MALVVADPTSISSSETPNIVSDIDALSPEAMLDDASGRYELFTRRHTFFDAIDACRARDMQLVHASLSNQRIIELLIDAAASPINATPDCGERTTMLANFNSSWRQRYGSYAFTRGAGCRFDESRAYDVCTAEFDCTHVDWLEPAQFICFAPTKEEAGEVCTRAIHTDSTHEYRMTCGHVSM